MNPMQMLQRIADDPNDAVIYPTDALFSIEEPIRGVWTFYFDSQETLKKFEWLLAALSREVNADILDGGADLDLPIWIDYIDYDSLTTHLVDWPLEIPEIDRSEPWDHSL